MEKVVNGQVSKPWGQVYGVILESETIYILLVWSIVMPVKEGSLRGTLKAAVPNIPKLIVKDFMEFPL